MTWRPRRRVPVVVMQLGLAWGAPVEAAGADAPESEAPLDSGVTHEAARLFDQALAAAQAGRLRDAERGFERAYELRAHFATLYNLALIRIELGESLAAVEALERYLLEGGNALEPERRERVLALISSERAKLASVEIWPTVAGARLSVDGAPPVRADAGPVWIAPGARQLAVEAPGHAPLSVVASLSPGDARRFSLATLHPPEPMPTAAPEPAAGPSPSLLEGTESSSALHVWPIALAGAGVLSASAALAIRIRANGEMDRWVHEAYAIESLPAGSPELDSRRDDNDRRRRSIERSDDFALGLAVAGGAAVVGSLLWWLLDDADREASAAGVVAGPGGVAYRARF